MGLPKLRHRQETGKHASTGDHVPPPLKDVEATGPAPVVPNRERTTYLTYLAERLRRVPGLVVTIDCQVHAVTLRAVAVAAGPGGPQSVPVAVTCDYHKGQWHFVRGGDGVRFASANEPGRAAAIVRDAIAQRIAQLAVAT